MIAAHALGDQAIGIAALGAVAFLPVVDEIGADIDIGVAGEVILQRLAQPDQRGGVVVGLAHGTAVLVGVAGIDLCARQRQVDDLVHALALRACWPL